MEASFLEVIIWSTFAFIFFFRGKGLVLSRIHFGFILVDSPKPVSTDQHFNIFVILCYAEIISKQFKIDLLVELREGTQENL